MWHIFSLSKFGWNREVNKKGGHEFNCKKRPRSHCLGNGRLQFHGLYILRQLIKALFKLNSSSSPTLTTKWLETTLSTSSSSTTSWRAPWRSSGAGRRRSPASLIYPNRTRTCCLNPPSSNSSCCGWRTGESEQLPEKNNTGGSPDYDRLLLQASLICFLMAAQ